MKNWVKSKTVWFNVLATLVAAGSEILKILPIGGALKVLSFAVPVGNGVLRFFTKEPIGTKAQVEKANDAAPDK